MSVKTPLSKIFITWKDNIRSSVGVLGLRALTSLALTFVTHLRSFPVVHILEPSITTSLLNIIPESPHAVTVVERDVVSGVEAVLLDLSQHRPGRLRAEVERVGDDGPDSLLITRTTDSKEG
jgi:hypothetical protein